MLTDGAPRLTVISVTMHGTTLNWSVAPSLLGSPSGLGFLVGTEDRSSADVQILSSKSVVMLHGDGGIHLLDLDGTSAGGFAQWP